MINMKNIIAFLFFINFALSSEAQKKRPILTVLELSITSTSQYCGGAAPPQELQDNLAKPKPLENKVIYVRKDKNDLSTPILYTLTTDLNGRASLKLAPGKYTFVDASKKDRLLYDALLIKHKEATGQAGPIDPKCLLEYMTNPDFEVIIPKTKKKATKKVGFNYFLSCNWAGVPCAEFRGQYPP